MKRMFQTNQVFIFIKTRVYIFILIHKSNSRISEKSTQKSGYQQNGVDKLKKEKFGL